MKYIELLVKIIFALSITTWEIGQRNLLSIEKGQKRTSGLTLGNERGEKNLKKKKKSKSRIRTGVKYIELLVKIIFALSISTWEIGQRNLLSIEKGQKRTSGLTLGNERGEKN